MFVQLNEEEIGLIVTCLQRLRLRSDLLMLADRLDRIKTEAYHDKKEIYESLLECAKDTYGEDGGNIDWDDEPTVRMGDEGAYVMGWFWVEFKDEEESK